MAYSGFSKSIPPDPKSSVPYGRPIPSRIRHPDQLPLHHRDRVHGAEHQVAHA
jgi:hypothetical protein